MKAIDIVLAPATSELELHNRWINRMASQFMSMTGKRVHITHLIECIGCGGTAVVEDPLCRNCRIEYHDE